MQEILQMSKNELNKYHILEQVLQKNIRQNKAAKLLNISDRQIRNLLSVYKKEGPKGLISKKRGKSSNRAFNQNFKQQVISIIRERYPDFGPTFAREKLLEVHNIKVSTETLRAWMIEERLWISRKSKPKIHPLRPRREYFGELIQIDGSHHHWFEDRADKCVLIVFIDDATSRLTSLFFCPTECLNGYFAALESHIREYGFPRALYSDRHAIFGGAENIHQAQLQRALKELNIESVLAMSPQAKGRVERVNQTLQDRLVKEMRLRNISSIKEGNAYLSEFMEEFNKKFSKEPRGQFDAHRPLDSGCDLERILARCEERTISNDLCISFHSKFYKIMEPQMINRLKNKRVEIRQRNDGRIRIFYGQQELKYMIAEEYEEHKILDYKDKSVWKPKKEWHPGRDHPWKNLDERAKLLNRVV